MTEINLKPLRSVNRQLLEQEIVRFTNAGWLIVSQTDTSVQMRKPKAWSQVGLSLALIGFLIGFVFLLVDSGIGGCLILVGILMLVLSVIDYLTSKERIVYFTVEDIKAGRVL